MELRAQWLTLSGEQAATVARLAQAVLHFELSRSVALTSSVHIRGKVTCAMPVLGHSLLLIAAGASL